MSRDWREVGFPGWQYNTLYAVSKAVSLHRDTVKRLLYGDSEPPNSQSRASIIDPYKDLIAEHLERYPAIRGTKPFRILKDRGYKGSVNTVIHYVRPLRKKITKTYKPMNYVAGENAQVDWAHFGKLKVAGGERKLYLFAMVLSYSRTIYAEFTFDISTESFLRLHERAFSYFGGTARKLLYDNLKSAVIDRVGNEVIFNSQLVDFSGFYGFELSACRPYAGNEKGRVERAIRYIRDSFASGYNEEILDARNRDLKVWLDTVANVRPWPQGRDKTVKSVWLEEKEFLLKPHYDRYFHAMQTKPARSSKEDLFALISTITQFPLNIKESA
ncbi:MAG: IS21 family transposase [Pseudobacteriovorax sp.]|nr:IS21 family transposase [Pseudobacteriovorax sp.]